MMPPDNDCDLDPDDLADVDLDDYLCPICMEELVNGLCPLCYPCPDDDTCPVCGGVDDVDAALACTSCGGTGLCSDRGGSDDGPDYEPPDWDGPLGPADERGRW